MDPYIASMSPIYRKLLHGFLFEPGLFSQVLSFPSLFALSSVNNPSVEYLSIYQMLVHCNVIYTSFFGSKEVYHLVLGHRVLASEMVMC